MLMLSISIIEFFRVFTWRFNSNFHPNLYDGRKISTYQEISFCAILYHNYFLRSFSKWSILQKYQTSQRTNQNSSFHLESVCHMIIIINLIYLFLGSDQLTLIFNVSDALNIFYLLWFSQSVLKNMDDHFSHNVLVRSLTLGLWLRWLNINLSSA